MTTNYGTILSDSDGAIGEVVSIDPPEYMHPTIESTNHSSGGVRKFESSGLREMTEFKATVNFVPADITSLSTDMVAGTKKAYTITFPNTYRERFSAFVTGIKPLTADALKPDELKAEITFRPTDSLDLSS